MGNKNRPGKPPKRAKKQDADDQLADKRAKRKERKHNLKISRRKAQRRGVIAPVTPQVQ